MTLQQLLSPIRRAIDDYRMIEENDHIAVGISGGKDSLTLLHALYSLKRFYPVPFTLTAVTVDLGFKNQDLTQIREYCRQLGVPYQVISTEIAGIVFDSRNEKNPCSLCSKMRKGALNNAIAEIGCNKVAYAHHMDDVVDTLFLSLFYEGRFHTFEPVTHLERSKLTVIRPMIYVKERDVIGFINKQRLPVMKSPCPADQKTRREYIKQTLKSLSRETLGLKERIFSAIKDNPLPGWEKQMPGQEGEENGSQ